MHSHLEYPITAVVGQESICQALVLAAIDPKIGGVLIQGPKGTAKTTMARGIAKILPQGNFVNLPLGVTEDRLTGSINLEKVLDDGSVQFLPGLLKQAHQGVLYIDEVNLLADHLVDLLLDVAASGKNYVERDGISHEHPAKILLIGTMNPDEGELRSQILDRFGFCIQLNKDFSEAERIEIIKRRFAFDENPKSFCSQFENDQQELMQRCSQARERLANIPISEENLTYAAQLSQRANVEGLRADIVIIRGARARAAFFGRKEILQEDIDFVAQFALAHRRLDDHSSNPPNGKHQQDNKTDSQDQSQGIWGELPPQSVDTGMTYKFDWQAEKQCITFHGKGNEQSPRGSHGHTAKNYSGSIDWISTLRQMQKTTEKFVIDKIFFRQRVQKTQDLLIILLDTSSSTLKNSIISKAKGLIAGVADIAYKKRRHLALFCFAGRRHEMVLAPARAPKNTQRLLRSIRAGGGTALKLAVDKTLRLINKFSYNQASLMIISDGRCKDNLKGLRIPWPTLFVDLEESRTPLGRCRLFAQQTGADYIHINTLNITHEN